MIIHSVYFWLKEEVTGRQVDSFFDGLAGLGLIGAVDRVHVGLPAATENRDVVDNSFDAALIVELANLAAQEEYQADPIHAQFVEEFRGLWQKVLVHDTDTEARD
jgi:hypothetical protein